jgi:hypothetical protein
VPFQEKGDLETGESGNGDGQATKCWFGDTIDGKFTQLAKGLVALIQVYLKHFELLEIVHAGCHAAGRWRMNVAIVENEVSHVGEFGRVTTTEDDAAEGRRGKSALAIAQAPRLTAAQHAAHI